MRIPAKVNKMSLDEQEKYLSDLFQRKAKELEDIRRKLATVRGGMKIKAITEERPDLEYEIPK